MWIEKLCPLLVERVNRIVVCCAHTISSAPDVAPVASAVMLPLPCSTVTGPLNVVRRFGVPGDNACERILCQC